MFTEESKHNTQHKISKSLLKTIHDRQLMNGVSNNKQKEEIISTLGGIDQILSRLLKSNVNFNDKQLQSLHHIITHTNNNYKTTNIINKTHNNIEDKGYKRKLEFTFNDNDILLYKIFTEQTAINIINILNNKITKILLAMIVFASLFVAIAGEDVMYTYASFMCLMLSIYCFGWILYCNKLVMNMLFKEFEFWFKIFYLSLNLITRGVIRYVEGAALFFNWTGAVFTGSILFLVMIFDAINIKQSNKLIISSFALGAFSRAVLYWSQIAFWRDEFPIYDKLTITTPNVSVLGTMTLNIIDIARNSSLILAIFLFKQLISSIRKPEQALVIKNKPFIIYENTKQHI
eukprot:532755_1